VPFFHVLPRLFFSSTETVRATWCVEARSRSWQFLSRTWNDIVRVLRAGDLLSDVERDELVFSVLRGAECETFFGVPEYVILPTAFTSPVFCARVWRRSMGRFPLATPALHQTCDLLTWLAVTLRLTPIADRAALSRAMQDVAQLSHRAIHRESAQVVSSLLNLRSSLAALCHMLHGLSRSLNRLRETREEEAAAEADRLRGTTSTAGAPPQARIQQRAGRRGSMRASVRNCGRQGALRLDPRASAAGAALGSDEYVTVAARLSQHQGAVPAQIRSSVVKQAGPRGTVASQLSAMSGSAPALAPHHLNEFRQSLASSGPAMGAISTADIISAADVSGFANELHSLMSLLKQCLSDVKDIFSRHREQGQPGFGERIAFEAMADELEIYGRLRRLLRIELLGDAAQLTQALLNLSKESSRTVLAALTQCLATANPGGEPVNEEAKRQLVFLCNSLYNRRLHKPPPVAHMKSFTSLTPYYSEDVEYTWAALKKVDDDVDLHSLLTSIFPDEWSNMLERLQLDTSDLREGKLPEAEVGRWASDRSQVLARTIRGVARHGDALRLQARFEGVKESEIELLVDQKFEYLVSCQNYGAQRRSQSHIDIQKADAIDQLRRQFASNFRMAFVEREINPDGKETFNSVLLGVDSDDGRDIVLYKVRLPGNPIIGEGKPENQNHAIIFARGECMQTLDMNQDNYLGESLKMRNLLELFRGDVRVVGFPEHIFSVSGGAVAHFSASNEIVFGSTVQRFLTWPLMCRFHYGHPDVWDKVWAVSCGGVAKASRTLHVSEDIFGGFNVILRGGTVDYAEFIHCGKGRDMGFIAVMGFETKISAGSAVTTVSRDMMRMMRSFDIFRLLSFYCSMSGFYVVTLQAMWSVYLFTLTNLIFAMLGMETYDIFEFASVESASNVSAANSSAVAADVSCSRAGRALNEQFQLAPEVQGLIFPPPPPCSYNEDTNPFNLDWSNFFTDLFSFNSAGSSDQVVTSNGAADGLLDVNDENIITEQYAAEVYSSAFILHLGMLMMIPLFLEHTVQRSLFYALKELLRMFASLSFIFYPFSMQTRGHNFGYAVNYGRAGYVATGRGYAIDTSSLVTMYSNYAASHIYFGFEIGAMLTVYEQWNDPSKTILSSWGMWTVALSLTLAPWLFNPHSLQLSSLAPSWLEWTHWLYGIGNLKVGRSCWANWARERLRLKRRAPRRKKIELLARNGSSKLLLFMACVQGLVLEVERTTTWRVMLTLIATLIMITASVPIATGIGIFEFFMQEAHRTMALPIYSVALCTAGYIIVACGLMRLEQGQWHGPTELFGQRNVWYLMLAASSMQAWLVQILGTLPDRPAGRSRFRCVSRWRVFRRKWFLIYASFWQRMTDQVIALVIFCALFVLSVLPVSSLQTRILFNQAFTEVIEKKIHRQNLVSELYTPGFFHKVEANSADESQEKLASAPASRRAPKAFWKASKASRTTSRQAPAQRVITPRDAPEHKPVTV